MSGAKAFSRIVSYVPDNDRGRKCLWVIYGAPVLLGIVTTSIIVYSRYVILPSPIGLLLGGVWFWNALLAIAASMVGATVRERSSATRRTLSPILHGAAGFAIYFALILLFVTSHDALLSYGIAHWGWERAW